MVHGGEEALMRQYAIGDEIGRGRFGTVRRCISNATGEALALKTTPAASRCVTRSTWRSRSRSPSCTSSPPPRHAARTWSRSTPPSTTRTPCTSSSTSAPAGTSLPSSPPAEAVCQSARRLG
ncbi:hypothetical protein ZWY2020_006857 [Hordeum vulgare]|nr:hypothetical protein ZWY2020_006857 [Hordeum vulgare]